MLSVGVEEIAHKTAINPTVSKYQGFREVKKIDHDLPTKKC